VEVVMKLRSMLALGCAALPAIVSAEEAGERNGGQRTAVYLQAGYSPSSWHMGGAALGSVFVRELTSRLSAEASASYLGRGMGSSAVTAPASLLVGLRPTHERAVPYLAAGGGFYRASFDMGSDRFNGPMDMGGSMMGGYGMMGMGWTGAEEWDFGQMPHFYGARLAGQPGGEAPYSGRRSFTDPVVSLGGGIRIDLGSRLYLRPDLRALVVVSGGETDTSGLFTVNLGYRF
jgi:hypothetical protein